MDNFLNNLLSTVGVKASVILAGFGGALARIALLGPGTNTGVVMVLLSVMGGTLTAVYVGPIIPNYLGWPDDAKSTAAAIFFAGAFGMEIMKQILAAVSRWTPTAKNGGGQ